MTMSFLKRFAFIGGLSLAAASMAEAQDSGALLTVLIRKGILTDQEAEDIRAELVRDFAVPPAIATGGSTYTTRLRISGRLQTQFARLDTNIDGAAADPDPTQHFFARRVYLTARADLGPDWNMNITYDFAGSLFDAAWVQWRKGLTTVDIGLRKVNLGYEERTSSGSLKAIERSGPTRYFVEENNGRRLGAGSYRVGIFADGRSGQFFWGAAVTNPERAVNFGTVAGVGSAANNDFAFWANGGFNGVHSTGTYLFGAGVGQLPDQGGKTLGAGNDLMVYTLYTDLTFGRLNFAAEYLASSNDRGASATVDSDSWGYWVQPSFLFTPKFEGVFRYSFLDSDGRGVNLSDGVRSSPGGGTMDKLTELYLGFNYYILGNDLKFQLGYVYGKSEDTIAGAPAEAEVNGVRSMLQINF